MNRSQSTQLEDRLRKLRASGPALSQGFQMPELRALADAAIEAGHLAVAAEALANVAQRMALSGETQAALKQIDAAMAWAALAEEPAPSQLLVQVFRVVVLEVADRVSDAIAAAALALQNPALRAATPDTQRLLYAHTAFLYESAGQPEQAVDLLLRAMSRAVDSGDITKLVAIAYASLMLSTVNLARMSSLFAAHAVPVANEQAVASALRSMAIQANEVVNAHPAVLLKTYGRGTRGALLSLRRIARALGLMLPGRLPALALDEEVAARGLAQHSSQERYLGALADMLEGSHAQALATLEQDLQGATMNAGVAVHAHYLASRACLRLGNTSRALMHYETHVALTATLRRSADLCQPLNDALANQKANEHLPADWPKELQQAVGNCLSRGPVGVQVADLAHWAGLSERWLRGAFQAHLGMSPKDWLQHQRLLAARRMLQLAHPADARLAVASKSWGFSTLARFRASYRAAFDEDPVDTLRQSTGRTRD